LVRDANISKSMKKYPWRLVNLCARPNVPFGTGGSLRAIEEFLNNQIYQFMKKILACAFLIMPICSISFAQNSKQVYPEPEFMKEIYALNKENNSLVRLQKEASQMETKTKMGGFGGAQQGYTIEGERSKIRFSSSRLPTFVFRSRELQSSVDGGMGNDSLSMMMGDDSLNKMMAGMGSMNSMMDDILDPSKMISLYSLDPKKGSRTLILQSSGGTFSRNKKSNNKYTLSFRKVKDGYYEIVVDKTLPRGEYGFVNSAMGSMEAILFVFGVD